jgi:hypothetical protein
LLYREGNDGTWSTSEIRVGTPAQTVRVLPATTKYRTLVVYNVIEGATDVVVGGESKDAERMRGLFDPERSLSWESLNRFRLNALTRDGERQYGTPTLLYPLKGGTDRHKG